MASPAIWIGTYGLGALAVLAAGVPLLLVARRWKLAGLAALLLPGITAGAIASIAGAGAAAAINGKAVDAPQRTPITLLHPNLGQADKWEGGKAQVHFPHVPRRAVP